MVIVKAHTSSKQIDLTDFSQIANSIHVQIGYFNLRKYSDYW